MGDSIELIENLIELSIDRRFYPELFSHLTKTIDYTFMNFQEIKDKSTATKLATFNNYIDLLKQEPTNRDEKILQEIKSIGGKAAEAVMHKDLIKKRSSLIQILKLI